MPFLLSRGDVDGEAQKDTKRKAMRRGSQPRTQRHLQRHLSSLGWEFTKRKMIPTDFSQFPLQGEWEPVLLDIEQFAGINMLCKGGSISKADSEFIEFVAKKGIKVEEFLARLVETRLVATKGNEIRLITEECLCVAMPDGKFYVGENNTGRMERWIAKYSGAASGAGPR